MSESSLISPVVGQLADLALWEAELAAGPHLVAVSLADRLAGVPDPRRLRGRRHPLAVILVLAACATLVVGNDSVAAIWQWAAGTTQDVLARLDARYDALSGRFLVPSERTFRRVLSSLDGAAMAARHRMPTSARHRRSPQTFIAGSVRRRRLWLLHRLMADRASAAELRSYGLRRFLLDQYDRVMGAETNIQLDLARKVTTTTSIGSVISGVATGAVYALLALLLLDGQIPLAAAATCVLAVQAAQRALTTVTFQIDRVYAEGQHVGDYTGFLTRATQHLPDHQRKPIERPVPGPLTDLVVDGVTLFYPDRDTPAVDGVSLTIRAGQTVAFVGENGSGKTTLAAMIAGLRQPSAGSITWNGTPLEGWDPDGLHARIGVVTQEYHKWPFTAATNIAIGETTAEPDQERIEAAAARAVAHDMILDLPHGYETLLDRTFANGQDLSGGQWQRITAARGFLRTSDLLIMDEPSSALDPRAEDALFQAIRDRQGSATTILITHRLANVRHADRIFVMHHGALAEAGSHDDLINAGGRYAELFALQSAGYLDPSDPATTGLDIVGGDQR